MKITPFKFTDDRPLIRRSFYSVEIAADALAGDSGIITTGGDDPSSWTDAAAKCLHFIGPMIRRAWQRNLLPLILIDVLEIFALGLGSFPRDQFAPAPIPPGLVGEWNRGDARDRRRRIVTANNRPLPVVILDPPNTSPPAASRQRMNREHDRKRT